MMIRRPDPRKSYAVLVGVGTYTDKQHTAVPAAVNNIKALQGILTGPEGCIAPENCAIIANPATPLEVLRPLIDFGAKATDLFFFYYVGHGFRSDRETLLLSVGTTASEALLRKPTSLNWNELRRILRDGVAAPRKIVVLDSCYSGIAADHLGPGSPELDIEGAYVLPSCPALSTIKAGNPYTFFTGALLEVLRGGIAEDVEYLTPKLIHAELARSLLRHRWNLPLPLKIGTVEDLPLLPNPGYKSTEELTLGDKFGRLRRRWAMHRQRAAQNRSEQKVKQANTPSSHVAPADSVTSLTSPSAPEKDSCAEGDTTEVSNAVKGGAGGGALLVVLIIAGIAVFNSADTHPVGNLPVRGETPINDGGNLRYELRASGVAVSSAYSLPAGSQYRNIRTSSVGVALAQGCRSIEFSLAIKVDGQELYSAGFRNSATGAARIKSGSLPLLDKVDIDVTGAAKELAVVAQATMEAGCTFTITLNSFEVVDSDTRWILDVV